MEHIKNNIKRVAYSIMAFCILVPTLVSAHVKWFAEPEEYVRPYQLTDLPVILAIIISLAVILVAIYLEQKLAVPSWYSRFIEKTAPTILSIASIGFGLSYLIFSYNGFIFAPNLQATGEIGASLIALQTLAGIMILFGIYERIGGFLLILLFIFSIRAYGFHEMMDTFEMVGFAFYAMIIGRPKWRISESDSISRLMHHVHRYGVSILRVATGLNFLVLGFSEKIFSPSLTQNFLAKYDWNFMYNLGFTWFSDYWFAFACGVAELLFGILFIFGLVTRLSVIALAVFLATTLILLGPVELVGHLPHFSIAAVLLVFGAGSRLHMRKE